jgi:hypothetical protein
VCEPPCHKKLALRWRPPEVTTGAMQAMLVRQVRATYASGSVRGHASSAKRKRRAAPIGSNSKVKIGSAKKRWASEPAALEGAAPATGGVFERLTNAFNAPRTRPREGGKAHEYLGWSQSSPCGPGRCCSGAPPRIASPRPLPPSNVPRPPRHLLAQLCALWESGRHFLCFRVTSVICRESTLLVRRQLARAWLQMMFSKVDPAETRTPLSTTL